MRANDGTGYRGIVAGVCVFLAVSAVGCKKDADADPASGSGTAAGPQMGKYSDEAMSFMLGRKYAFSCIYAQLDKPAEASSSNGAAKTLAGALGVTPPAIPAKADGFKALGATAIPDELQTKKGAKVASAYRLGVSVTDAWFGTMLGSDIKKVLGDVETNAKAAGVPESVYKTQLDAIKAKPTDDALARLAAGLEGYFKGP